MRLSVKDLQLYQKCPRAYRLHKLEGVEAQRVTVSWCKSTTAREVIKELCCGAVALSHTQVEIEKICEAIWRSVCAKADQEELNEVALQAKPATKTRGEIALVTKGEKALEQIKTWCVAYWQMERDKTKGSPALYETEILGYEFCGTIDLVRFPQIYFFKTSSQVPSLTYLARDFEISLVSHAFLFGKVWNAGETEYTNYSIIPHANIYYLPNLETYKRNTKTSKAGDLKGNPAIPCTRSKQTLLDFEYEVLDVVRGIEKGHFHMAAAPLNCSICQYAYACTSGVEPNILQEIEMED